MVVVSRALLLDSVQVHIADMRASEPTRAYTWSMRSCWDHVPLVYIGETSSTAIITARGHVYNRLVTLRN